ncbi:helix-turn-helix domain-containing protein [Spirillospora albida]|uniref:helix-turn-helix domain-containing protein n=1 Tax=Spirillospora albida TaxID=58123 RepID=UPI0006902606|nr:helix-turn-helix domain-containing protein [Spirillospora albida]
MSGENASEAKLDPSSATTEEEFVVALRRLRERSGLTFKEIERRTSATGGYALPASTLATALHRHNAPRREMVAELVRVCGGGPEDVARWLATRERLVHPMTSEPEAPAAPPETPPSTRRISSRTVAATLASVAVAAITGAAYFTRPAEAPSETPPPAAGPSATTVLKLGDLCLSERRNDRSGRIYLTDCAKSFPPRALTRHGTLWRITTVHPQFGPGCMGVVDGSAEPGTPLSDDTCDRIQTDRFTMRRTPRGHQLLPENRDLCVGVKGTPTLNAPVLQLPCDPNAPGQLFNIAETPTE